PRLAVARVGGRLRPRRADAARHAGVGGNHLRPPQPDQMAVRSDLRCGAPRMNILRDLNLGRRILPIIIASEAAECGLGCLAMISRYYGHDIDLNALRQRFPISLAGASLRSLMGIADQLGFSSRAIRVEMSALSK